MGVVVAEDVSEDDSFDLFTLHSVCRYLIQLFFFQRGKEAFHTGIIIAMSCAAEALNKSVCYKFPAEGVACILAATVTVKDSSIESAVLLTQLFYGVYAKFLLHKEKSTLKEISESLGKETIDSFNTSTNRGQSESYGMNYQKLGKELKSQDELAVMDGGKCILQLRGVRPFFSDKYDITRHKNYSELLDANPKKKFDIQSFVSDRSGMVSNISPKDQISQWVIDKSSSALKEVTYPADATERENAEAEAVYDADSETDIDGDTADS